MTCWCYDSSINGYRSILSTCSCYSSKRRITLEKLPDSSRDPILGHSMASARLLRARWMRLTFESMVIRRLACSDLRGESVLMWMTRKFLSHLHKQTEERQLSGNELHWSTLCKGLATCRENDSSDFNLKEHSIYGIFNNLDDPYRTNPSGRSYDVRLAQRPQSILTNDWRQICPVSWVSRISTWHYIHCSPSFTTVFTISIHCT
jgi:hypothetical protein